MKTKIIIVGVSLTSERIFNMVERYNLFEVVGFAIDEEYITHPTFKNLPIYNLATLEETINSKKVKLFVAIAWDKLNKDRKELFLRLKYKKFNFVNVLSPNANIYSIIDGENIWVGENVVIEKGVKLGSNTFIDHKAYIGSDTIIKEHCYIGANSLIAGKCIISEQCFIGLNATIFDHVTIGNKCIIGASTIVKRNILDFNIIKTGQNLNVIIQSTESEIENKLISAKSIR